MGAYPKVNKDIFVVVEAPECVVKCVESSISVNRILSKIHKIKHGTDSSNQMRRGYVVRQAHVDYQPQENPADVRMLMSSQT